MSSSDPDQTAQTPCSDKPTRPLCLLFSLYFQVHFTNRLYWDVSGKTYSEGASVPLSTWMSSPLHLQPCRRVDSDESIPPLRPRGRTGVFQRQQHHRFSVKNPLRVAQALRLDLSTCTDLSCAASCSYGYGIILPYIPDQQDFLVLAHRVVYTFWGSRTGLPGCDKGSLQGSQ